MSGQTKAGDDITSLLARDTINSWLDRALGGQATVIHIEPHQTTTIVRFRIDGVLHNVAKVPNLHHGSLIEDVKRRSKDLDKKTGLGSFEYTHQSQPKILKFSILPVIHGEKAVIYLFETSQNDNKLSSDELINLGFWGDSKARIEHAICQPHGVILAGSINQFTASRALASISETIISAQKEVVNINPLPDQNIDSINHLANASDEQVIDRLAFAMQQNNKVIIAGHLNGRPLIEAVFEAALSKKLILGTVSATSTTQIISRLLASGSESHLIAASLRLAVAVRPARKLCQNCRQPYDPSATAWKKISKLLGFSSEKSFFKTLHDQEVIAANELGSDLSDLSTTAETVKRLWQPSHLGCEQCNHSGYKGRIALNEVMEPNADIQRAIITNQTTSKIEQTIRQQGVYSLEFDGLVKALRGLTSLEEIVDKRYR